MCSTSFLLHEEVTINIIAWCDLSFVSKLTGHAGNYPFCRARTKTEKNWNWSVRSEVSEGRSVGMQESPVHWLDFSRTGVLIVPAAAWFQSGSCLNNQAAAWFCNGGCLINQAAAWFWSGSGLIDQTPAWFWSGSKLIDQAATWFWSGSCLTKLRGKKGPRGS